MRIIFHRFINSQGASMFVPKLDFVLLFVENPERSAQFYSTLFSRQPIEQSPTFAMFVLENGVKLGLWSRETVEPEVTSQPGGSEIAFIYDDVEHLYEAWQEKGVSMAQSPTDMDFGRTFVALDPDGHRIRIFNPSLMVRDKRKAGY